MGNECFNFTKYTQVSRFNHFSFQSVKAVLSRERHRFFLVQISESSFQVVNLSICSQHQFSRIKYINKIKTTWTFGKSLTAF